MRRSSRAPCKMDSIQSQPSRPFTVWWDKTPDWTAFGRTPRAFQPELGKLGRVGILRVSKIPAKKSTYSGLWLFVRSDYTYKADWAVGKSTRPATSSENVYEGDWAAPTCGWFLKHLQPLDRMSKKPFAMELNADDASDTSRPARNKFSGPSDCVS